MATDRHYPLNGLDLSFHRYHHHRLDVIDVLACCLMDAWLFPRRDPVNPGKAHSAAFERPRCHQHRVTWKDVRFFDFIHTQRHPRPSTPEVEDQGYGLFM